MFFEVGFLAYLINRVIGWFQIKNPIDSISDYIKWFKKKFYKDEVLRGAILSITLILSTFIALYSIDLYIGYMTNIYIQTALLSLVASIAISSKILDKNTLIYNVIAPIFYLILFGIEGIFIYKAINTLDSMVDKNFGKSSAILNNIVSYIPLKVTNLFIKDNIKEVKLFQQRLDISILILFIITLLVDYYI